MTTQSIPIEQLVSGTPSVLPAGGGNINQLNGLLLSQDPATPQGVVTPWSSAAAIGAFYGLASPEYEAAGFYFGGPAGARSLPQQLLIAAYNPAPVAGFLRSAQVSSMTLAELQALSGVLTIIFAGVSNTSSSISLAGATSFTNAAALILAGFTTPAFGVTYDTQRGCFLFTSTATGATETATYASGSLAAGLLLTAATGATISQGAAAATPATAMPAIVAINQSWAGFTTTFEPVLTDKEAFSAWTNSTNKRYGYFGFDSDVNALIANTTETWMYAVTQANENGTCAIFGNATHAAAAMGWMASLNFTLKNGRATLFARDFAGLIPSCSNGEQSLILTANGYNFYGLYSGFNGQYMLLQNGQVSGVYNFMDSYVQQIQLNQSLIAAMVELLMTAGFIPYNADGYNMISEAAQGPIAAALNFGTIVAGVTLSAAQIQEIIAIIGTDVSAAIQAQGWYLQIVDAAPSTRSTRSSPPMTLLYCDGESIQSIQFASINIQ
jgi:hypothetical protein